MAALVGTVLGGKLRLVRCLGAGTFGEVYEAVHVQGHLDEVARSVRPSRRNRGWP